MAPRATRINKDLTVDEIQYYYSLLNEEITSYDCGELCKGDNEGVPYCCIVENAVPLLYKNEFAHLESQGDLWHIWKPANKSDKKLMETAGRDQLFCECKGISHCVRDQRSISCRTFPMEPYIDRRGVFVGLTFMQEFSDKDRDTGKTKCPLTARRKDIRQDYIDSHFMFWEKLLLRREEEYDTYKETSMTLRRLRTRIGRTFVVLLPSHFQDSKTVKKYLY